MIAFMYINERFLIKNNISIQIASFVNLLVMASAMISIIIFTVVLIVEIVVVLA